MIILKNIVNEFKVSAENGTENINTEVIILKNIELYGDFKNSTYKAAWFGIVKDKENIYFG